MQFGYEMLWIFFIYSFLGWICETIYVVIKNKKFIYRGLLNGPICTVYGVAAVMLEIGFKDLTQSLFFLFVGCFVLCTVIELFTAKLLERIGHRRWWNYADKRFNIDGYICLEHSLIWGVLGMLVLIFVNPLLLNLFQWLPDAPMGILIWILVFILIVDALGSYLVAAGVTNRFLKVKEANNWLTALSHRLGNWLAVKMNNRLEKAYPIILEKVVKQKSTVFAKGCSFYKIALLFVIGGFLGDIVEMIFCRLTAGVWMSRSSVVWGPFSIVWGLAIALATVLLYKYREKSDGMIFVIGFVLGGVYEYLCSVFTEIVFGKVFWDYSWIPFNLGGRINLLYCFFWGIAAVVWLKKLYPVLSKHIENIPMKIGIICTWILIVFMLVNMILSTMALIRYSLRGRDIPASSGWEVWMDTYYDDVKMEHIYPNASDIY